MHSCCYLLKSPAFQDSLSRCLSRYRNHSELLGLGFSSRGLVIGLSLALHLGSLVHTQGLQCGRFFDIHIYRYSSRLPSLLSSRTINFCLLLLELG